MLDAFSFLSPQNLAVALIFLSAICHASANAILKTAPDKLVANVVIIITRGALMIPFIFFVPMPEGQQWLWIALSTLIHVCYQFLLTQSYHHADFSVAYPLARGIAPLFTAIGAFVLLQDDLTAQSLTGICMISAGILLFSTETKKCKHTGLRDLSPTAFFLATATGLCVVAYTLVDTHIVRTVPSILTFFAWMSLPETMIWIAIILRTRSKKNIRSSVVLNGFRPVISSVIWLSSYLLALYAFRMWNLAELAALRETSILFGALIGFFLLKEKMGKNRVAASLVIIAGIFTMKVL